MAPGNVVRDSFLFETHGESGFDKVIVVSAPTEIQKRESCSARE